MKNVSKKMALIVLLSLQSTQSFAIGNVLLWLGTSAIAAANMGLGQIVYDSDGYSSFSKETRSIIAGSYGLFTTVMGYRYLKTFTSEGRLKEAVKLLAESSLFSVFSDKEFQNQEEIISFSKDHFAYYKYPLVQCEFELSSIKGRLNKSVGLLFKARFEADSDASDRRCEDVGLKVRAYIAKVDQYISFLKNSQEYQQEFKICQEERNARINAASRDRAAIISSSISTGLSR